MGVGIRAVDGLGVCRGQEVWSDAQASGVADGLDGQAWRKRRALQRNMHGRTCGLGPRCRLPLPTCWVCSGHVRTQPSTQAMLAQWPWTLSFHRNVAVNFDGSV